MRFCRGESGDPAIANAAGVLPPKRQASSAALCDGGRGLLLFGFQLATHLGSRGCQHPVMNGE
jgi:hypothetical protein